MKRKSSVSMPYEPVPVKNDTLSIDVDTAKRLILFTGDKNKLAGNNEYQLDSRIQTGYGVTINDSSIPFDNGVGTIRITNPVTDNVWITKLDGFGKAKVMSSGYLQANNMMTIDKTNHCVIEEFILKNYATANSPTVLESGDSASGWTASLGTNTTVVSENGRLKLTGTTDSSGRLRISKRFVNPFLNKDFLTFIINSSVTTTLYCIISDYPYTSEKMWSGAPRIAITANTDTTFVLPIHAPAGTIGSLPTSTTITNTAIDGTVDVYIGITGATNANTAVTIYIDNICTDVRKSAYLEMSVPDYLADQSLQLSCWDGTQYQSTGIHKLDSSYALVTGVPDNWKYLSGVKLNDVYSSTSRAVFPKNTSGSTVTGSTGNITYSIYKGTKQRIGIRVDLVPYDNGRTNSSSIRLQVKTYYDSVNGVLKTLPDAVGNNNGTITECFLASNQNNISNKALKFSGASTCYVNCGDPAALRITGAITLEAWVKMTDTTLTGVIISKGESFTSPGNFGYALGFYGPSKEMNFDTYSNTDRSSCYAGNFITDTNWHHIVATWDGTTNTNGKKIYLDGVLKTQSTSTISAIGTPSYNFYIGRDGTTPRAFNGLISEVRVYNRSLSQSEVIANYQGNINRTGLVGEWILAQLQNMGSATYELSNTTDYGQGLQLLNKPWLALLDAPKLDILSDSSGNSNNGTMTAVSMDTDQLNNPFGALKFNGTSSFVKVGTVITSLTPHTIVAYVKTPSSFGPALYDYDRRILSKYFDSNNAIQLSLFRDGGFYYSVRDAGTDYTVSTIGCLTNTWYHVVCTYDTSNRVKIYINSVNKTDGTETGWGFGSGTSLCIGVRCDGSGYYSGSISYINLYSRVLSQSEVVADYNGQYVNPSGLVASWKPYQPNRNIDYYVFNKKPISGQYSYDENGNIYNATFALDPNSRVYKGRLKNVNLIADTNSDLIPNFVDGTDTLSIKELVGHLDYVYDYLTRVDITSSVATNDFSLTTNDIDIFPYAVSSGNSVYDATNTRLLPVETVSTANGSVDLYDVKNQSKILINEGAPTGICKVYDTVTTGNTTEATWVRVYTTDWQFTGDRVIENGLVRIKYPVSPTDLSSVYFWNGSAYTSSYGVPYAILSGNFTITTLTPDLIICSSSGTTSNRYFATVATMRRGASIIRLDQIAYDYNFTIYPQTRFRMLNNTITDNNLIIGSYDNPTLSTSPYVCFFSPNSTSILLYITPRNERLDAEFTAGGITHVSSELLATSKPIYIGSIPYDCSKLYYEAESIYSGTKYTGSDAYPGTGNTGALFDIEYTGIEFLISNPGTYKIFIRCKTAVNGNGAQLYTGLKNNRTSQFSVSEYSTCPDGFGYVSSTKTIPNDGDTYNLRIERTIANSVIDYVLLVPTDLINKYAKRALVNTTATRSIEKTNV